MMNFIQIPISRRNDDGFSVVVVFFFLVSFITSINSTEIISPTVLTLCERNFLINSIKR